MNGARSNENGDCEEMDKKTILKRLIALQRAVARRNWEEVEEEIEGLTEIIADDCTKPIIRTVVRDPVFSPSITRYYGNSGLSGGCTQPHL